MRSGELGLTERIDEVRCEFRLRFGLRNLFVLIFDDNLIIVYFDNRLTRDSELGVEESLKRGALHDELINVPGGNIERKIDDFADFRLFLSNNPEAGQSEVKLKNIPNFNDGFVTDYFVGRVDNDAELGEFADALDGEKVAFNFPVDEAFEPDSE